MQQSWSVPKLPSAASHTHIHPHKPYRITIIRSPHSNVPCYSARRSKSTESPTLTTPFHSTPAHPLTHSPTHSLATLQKLKVQRDKLKKYQKQVSRPNFYASPEPPITQLHAQLHLLTHALAGSPDRSIWYYKRRRKSRRNSIERRRRSKLDSPAPHVFQLRIALPCWLDLGHSAAVLYRRRMFHLQRPLPTGRQRLCSESGSTRRIYWLRQRHRSQTSDSWCDSSASSAHHAHCLTRLAVLL